MISTNRIEDHLHYLVQTDDLPPFGNSLKAMICECTRVVPFQTVNVVGRITLMCKVGMYALLLGKMKESFTILSMLHQYCSRIIGWSEYVRNCTTVLSQLGVSQDCYDEVSSYLAGNTFSLMTYIEPVTGDIAKDVVILAPSQSTPVMRWWAGDKP